MKRQLRIAVVQLAAHDREEFSRIAPELLEKLRDCCANGAQLIIFPEGTIPGYVLGPAPLLPAEYTSTVSEIQQLAQLHSVHIVGGLAWPTAGNDVLPENAAGVFHPDGRLSIYAKRFLWHFDQHWYRAGTSLEPIDTSIGKLGVMVCADGRIPTIARALVDQGAEILVMPTAWVTSGSDDEKRPNIQADLMARMRAWENGVPFAAANKVGVERNAVMYCGKSQIIAADGTLIAMGSVRNAEILCTDVALEPSRPRRSARLFPVIPQDRSRNEIAADATNSARPTPICYSNIATEPGDNQIDAAPINANRNVELADIHLNNKSVRSEITDKSIRIGLSNLATDEIRNVARWSEIDLLVVTSNMSRNVNFAATARNRPGWKEPAATNIGTTDYDDRLALPYPTVVQVTQLPYNTLLDIHGLPTCICDDDDMADPAYLAAWRGHGCLLAIWRAQRVKTDDCIPLARLRAIELRIYIAILDEYRGERCLFIDPDGHLIAGTTGEFQLAQGTFDPQKIHATNVAPGTDILEGLRAVEHALKAAQFPYSP